MSNVFLFAIYLWHSQRVRQEQCKNHKAVGEGKQHDMNKGSGKTLKCVTLFTRWLRAIIILLRSCDPKGPSSPFPEWKQQFSQWDRSAWLQPPFQTTAPSQLWWQVQKLSCESSSCDYHDDESVKNVIFKTMCYFIINTVLQTTQKFWLPPPHLSVLVALLGSTEPFWLSNIISVSIFSHVCSVFFCF